MFENINSVDWDSLKQAHGTSGHVPASLLGLISDDPNLQMASYWKLENYILVQSDLYEAAYYVIPFLIEILKSDNHTAKKYAYELIYEIANGHAPESLKCVHDGEEVSLSNACRQAIGAEIDLYISEVKNTSSAVRANALTLLISLIDNKDKIISSLEDLLDRDPSTPFKILLRKGIDEIKNS